MKKIKLTQGKYAVVDDEDYEELSKHKWHTSNTGYAVRVSYTYQEGGGAGTSGNWKGKAVFIHRVVNGTPEGMVTDHINRDRLDNRRANLRTCTQKENMQNRSATRCKGVTFHSKLNKYQARIQKNKKRTNLGFFKKETEAIDAYQEAARRLYA